MTLTVYEYPNCSTCRKALKWLDARGLKYTRIDITQAPPKKSKLAAVLKTSGLTINKLFNTSGRSYREGNFKEKLKTMSEHQAIEALSADGKLIKRPLLIGEGLALVGFREGDYAEKLGR